MTAYTHSYIQARLPCTYITPWWFVFYCLLLRYGIRFDLFSDDDDLDGIDPITAKKINFLYNKAVVGKEYKEKPPAKGIVLRV